MNYRELKERVLTDRLFKGIIIGILGILALELVILLAVIGVRALPQGGGHDREAAVLAEAEPEQERPRIKKNVSEEEEEDVYEYNIPISKYRKVEGTIRRGEFFSTLMTRLGASQNAIYALDSKSKGVFDMRQIKVGYHYHAYYAPGEPDTLAYVVYEKDNASYVVFSLKDSLAVNVYNKDITSVIDYVEVNIENSLWQDIIDAGAPALLAISLADIYAWSIDFFGLQKGDSFRAVYEKTMCDGEILDVEKVLFAEFEHGDEAYRAYWFDDGSGNYYWNEKGESMRKAFLRAPLSYTRISSGFTYHRRHPITRKVRPHTGIDYAAPTGTEVMSIGDGVVVYKGYKRAEGNMVKIKHNSVYTSAYLHLSRYGKDIKVGQRVRQGQVIGYVGSTGYSTGPHLDFRIWKNGTPINPLKMESPPAEPLNKSKMREFEESKTESERAAVRFEARTVLRQMVETVTSE
ncbi:MAG TPA: peptidoglycan DD-metalloendopeptidase family protein [Candidatus Coprenecus stercoravium]|uniref:Peptidoglycan DD-metalloendopeptidase family protein n=1 Tax=Candidatus Coprenecus stercoravium TaxID=2840735 RepID=A0A9D2KAL5_9BACT|nr:peptidoglycan DD-metalloendopeptidase family protein [Candidatus Coprenecus stercoravium]